MAIPLNENDTLLEKIKSKFYEINGKLHSDDWRKCLKYNEPYIERIEGDSVYVEMVFYGDSSKEIDWNGPLDQFSVKLFTKQFNVEPFRLEWDLFHGLHINVNRVGQPSHISKSNLPWATHPASVGSILLSQPDEIDVVMENLIIHLGLERHPNRM